MQIKRSGNEARGLAPPANILFIVRIMKNNIICQLHGLQMVHWRVITFIQLVWCHLVCKVNINMHIHLLRDGGHACQSFSPLPDPHSHSQCSDPLFTGQHSIKLLLHHCFSGKDQSIMCISTEIYRKLRSLLLRTDLWASKCYFLSVLQTLWYNYYLSVGEFTGS